MRTAIWREFVTSVRLQLRNPAALVYGYAVPVVFLVAFWTLYRHESPPLARHLGQLLTITALSGACFAMPAWLVSDRERGVWRQYRLTPAPEAVHLLAVLGASYVQLLSAGALQIVGAAFIGTPLPSHPVHLWLAFTLTCGAFLGIGLLITMVGNSVPAAQALGQAVFLPMLILGGVAVPLERLPAWVQAIASALPGRYAVDAIEGALAGNGLARLAPEAAALAIMTVASGLASLAIFRWEPGQHIAMPRALTCVGLVAASWIAVGAVVKVDSTPAPAAQPPAERTPVASTLPRETAVGVLAPAAMPVDRRPSRKESGSSQPSLPSPLPAVQRTWRDVTMEDVDVNLVFVGLPPDHGVVTPINAEYRRREDVECVRDALATWPPGAVDDVVQRARNVLLVAAVPDILQLDVEHDMPFAVFDHLQRKIPKAQLVQVLYWIATHPSEGDLDALDHLAGACLAMPPPDDEGQIRERIAIYAMKLLGRLTGKIK